MANDPDSLRIYDFTQKTVDGFNNYVADFFETISILKENLEKLGSDQKEKSNEITGTIKYVENKIDELSAKMQTIAEEMSSLIEIAHHNEQH